MACEIGMEGQPELKKPKLELAEESKDDDTWWCNDEFYDEDENGLHEMNPKQWEEYLEHLEKSGGFDVPSFPDTIFYGIQPCYIYDTWTYGELRESSEFAIQENNKNEGTNFKYYRLVKATVEPVAGSVYYITFLAEDLKSICSSSSSSSDSCFGSGNLETVQVSPSGYLIVELQAKVYYSLPDEEDVCKMELLGFHTKDALSEEGVQACLRNPKN